MDVDDQGMYAFFRLSCAHKIIERQTVINRGVSLTMIAKSPEAKKSTPFRRTLLHIYIYFVYKYIYMQRKTSAGPPAWEDAKPCFAEKKNSDGVSWGGVRRARQGRSGDG